MVFLLYSPFMHSGHVFLVHTKQAISTHLLVKVWQRTTQGARMRAATLAVAYLTGGDWNLTLASRKQSRVEEN